MHRHLLRETEPGAYGASAAAPWVHAQANRRIALPGATVAYLLQRSRRRSLGFSIGDDGLTVRAPRGLSLAQIEQALRRKSDWIQAKLAAAAQRQRQLQRNRIQWQDGARIPYLGRHLVLQVGRSAATAQPRVHAAHDAAGKGALELQVPPDAEAQLLATLTQRWLREQARAFYSARLNHFAPGLGVHWQRLRLSSARARWGSASARGTISLHWRLIQLAPEVIDYVVVHELAHLLEMNHSARFWAHVARVLPDYAERRAALRAIELPPW